MFDNSSNISQCDFAQVCPEVSLFESDNFKFEGVVPFNVSADRRCEDLHTIKTFFQKTFSFSPLI